MIALPTCRRDFRNDSSLTLSSFVRNNNIGTSLCEVFKAEKCFTPLHPEKPCNCWYPELKTSKVNFSTQWVREAANNFFNFQRWTVLGPKGHVPSSSCDDINEHLQQHNQTLAMSENWLPYDGVCSEYFMNTIIVREPMSRLLSHYNHLLRECIRRNKNQTQLCTSNMLLDHDIDNSNEEKNGSTDKKIFNVTAMTYHFDIITDNYYLRSLNTEHIYRKPLGFGNKGSEYLKKALKNLRQFDWILLLGGGEENESNNLDFILNKGIGLTSGMGMDRVHHTSSKSMFSDESYLKTLNHYDSQIWEEAQILHQLDIESLRQLEKYGGETWKGRKPQMLNLRSSSSMERKETGSTQTRQCCGNICPMDQS